MWYFSEEKTKKIIKKGGDEHGQDALYYGSVRISQKANAVFSLEIHLWELSIDVPAALKWRAGAAVDNSSVAITP